MNMRTIEQKKSEIRIYFPAITSAFQIRLFKCSIVPSSKKDNRFILDSILLIINFISPYFF